MIVLFEKNSTPKVNYYYSVSNRDHIVKTQIKMSSVSVTSSKRETESSELKQELEAIRSMNASLRTYLEQMLKFKKNLADVHDNFKMLNKVNTEWSETLNLMRLKNKKT